MELCMYRVWKNSMIWVIGGEGMLGQQIKKSLTKSQLEYVSTDIEIDIVNYESLISYANNYDSIEWVINCSAYTAVDKAEDEEEKAYQINGLGVKNIAKACKKINAKLIHFSTDYVFDGDKEEAYSEDDRTNPVSVYGRTKLVGEEAIAQQLESYFIFRISWLYGVYGNNFVKTMVRLFKEKEILNIVGDQFGSPTYAATLSENVIALINKDSCMYGLYHYSDEGKISWYDFAKEIIGLVKDKIKISSVSTDQYPTKARRPKNSTFSKTKVNSLGFRVHPWKDNLEKYFKEVKCLVL